MSITYSIVAILTPIAIAQQPLWQLAGSTGAAAWYYNISIPFDHNSDGAEDVFVTLIQNPSTSSGLAVNRIVSGRDGTTLWQRSPSKGFLAVADFDGDGVRDYFTGGTGIAYYSRSMHLTSFATGQVLWGVEGPGEYLWGWTVDFSLTTDLDLTGDGRPDLLTMSSHTTQSVVYAYSNSGALLYTIYLHPYGWVGANVTAMPDLDGDGGQDFLIGCLEPSGRGAVVVVSGRTGSLLRISYGVLPGDAIGGATCNAGDIDLDGIPEYAAASYITSPLLSIVVFSGRTGAVLRNWTDFWADSGGLRGNVDVDLDGVPDLLAGGFGMIRAYSGRDGTVLWNLPNAGGPQPVINLGPQAGSPYPVIAFCDQGYRAGPSTSPSLGRVVAFRTNLVGTGPVTGTPCSSTARTPQIGMRTVPGHVRVTVSGGPPGALAWLVGGPAAQTTFEGALLPYALDPFALFGCSAYVPPVVVAPTILGTAGIDAGYGYFDLPWPALSTTGHAFAAQWLLLDPTTGAYALTARHEFRVP